MQFKKAFTLIELLVVIAVIGILAAIVTVSLSSVRKSGANTSVKSNLTNAMSQAEIIHMQLGKYPAITCANNSATSSETADDNTAKLLKMINEASKNGMGDSGSLACSFADQKFYISVKLQETDEGKDYWCADSSGYNGSTKTQQLNGLCSD